MKKFIEWLTGEPSDPNDPEVPFWYTLLLAVVAFVIFWFVVVVVFSF